MEVGPDATLASMGLARTAGYVAEVQREDGLIPWHAGGPADPWDHVEAAMGLSVGGREDAAEAAYRWLADRQLDDGSWWSVYGEGVPVEENHRETHHVAYVATGVWHHYLATGDRGFVAEMWPTVERALSFVLRHQEGEGEVIWAVTEDGARYEDALLTGCSSIYKSLECAIAMARLLGEPCDRLTEGHERLGTALRHRRERFDRTWESKGRYSMDWFYPVLCGAIAGTDARERLDAGMERFVEHERKLGCRCVADEPWVTVAETAELVMALAAAGRSGEAARIFSWLPRFRDEEGAFWIGYQFENDEIWPDERPTWTAGSVLLAADALSGITPASDFFGDGPGGEGGP